MTHRKLTTFVAWISRLGPSSAGIVAGLVVLAAAIATAWTLYAVSTEAVSEAVRRNLVRIAATAASLVDGDRHRTFTEPKQMEGAAYKAALKPLARVLEASTDIRYIYTCVLRGGKVHFVLDPTPQGDADGDGVQDKSKIMDPYENPPPAMLQALRTGETQADLEPTTDAWGTWFSGYAPIRNSTGQFVGIVGVDLSAASHFARLARVRQAAVIGLGMAALLSGLVGLGVYVFQRWAQSAKQRERFSGRIMGAQKQVLERIATDASLTEVLDELCSQAEPLFPGSRCVVITFGPEGNLQVASAPSMPASYASRLLLYPENTAWAETARGLRQVNVRTNLLDGPPGVAKFLDGYGVRGYWSAPILDATPECVGLLVALYSQPKEPSKEEMALLGTWTKLAALAIERRRFEAELAGARDKALEASRMKSEFLANMSHEIRTPMNGVIGMTDLLLSMEMADDQRDYALTARNSAHALLAVINDILDFSKIEAGKMEIEMAEFNLRELVEEVAELMAPSATAKDIELCLQLADEIPEIVKCDPVRVRQVLNNLISNAIKFTAAGEVVVSAGLLSEENGKAIIELAVADTGVGIPKDKLETVFASFTQVDGSTTRQYGGTGLGLSICKTLTDLMGGSISVESKLGEGSRFSVRLPVDVVERGDKPLPSVESLNGLRILIADDVATNRLILRKTLEAWGCEVSEAWSGHAALRVIYERGNSFDIAILDVQMPEIDGLAVAAEIKSMDSADRPKVLLLSSVGQHWSRAQLDDRGISLNLTKPVRRGHLLNGLLRCIGRPELPSTEKKAPFEWHVAERPARVLLAEDNPVNRKVVIRLLTRLGYDVDTAENGNQAVELASEHDYDIVLMDVEMPGMDGLEATRTIRASEEASSRHTVIIALTAYAMDDDKARCMQAGMDDFLTKPIQAEMLSQCIERWLQAAQRSTDVA